MSLIKNLGISIMVISALLADYSKETHGQSLTAKNDLQTWIGEYSFYEFIPPDINMDYNIVIYKENGGFFAKITIDGFQTMKRIKAKVSVNKELIDIVFEEYLPDNMFELYAKGDVLLSFKKAGSNIYTNWGKIQPVSPKNQVNNKIYFKYKK